ncbi:hypothetical protein [Hymenobacter algoricola]|uniref:Uncharacterized protein n=1 Tax=Hymenobacter algoricola TaxID=486267 RepID=A0ABP7NNL5_9BACT
MGQLHIPGDRDLKGPWFIGTKELEELDVILAFADAKFRELHERYYEEKTAQILKDYPAFTLETAQELSRNQTKVVPAKVSLLLSDKSTLHDTTVKGILKDARLKNLFPVEIALSVGDYRDQFTLQLGKNYGSDFRLKVNSADNSIQEDILYKVEEWVEKYQPTRPNRIWKTWAYIIGCIGVTLLSFSGASIVEKVKPDFKAEYTKDINQIIKTGVNKNNEAKAMELMLKYTTNYVPENVVEKTRINKNAIRYTLVGVALLMAGIFHPKTVIGVGRNKPYLEVYKWYTRFMVVTIPGVLLYPPLSAWLKDLLGL